MKDRITLQDMEPERPPIFLGCDAHRKYSVFVTVDGRGKASAAVRVEHDRPAFRRFLRGIQPGTPVALEAAGSWYWLVDEMEEAGLLPHLAQPFAARRMLGVGAKKTDTVDARYLATLLRNGTLPETWIPPADLMLSAVEWGRTHRAGQNSSSVRTRRKPFWYKHFLWKTFSKRC